MSNSDKISSTPDEKRGKKKNKKALTIKINRETDPTKCTQRKKKKEKEEKEEDACVVEVD